MLGKKILIADDDPKICKFLTSFLVREGFKVESLHRGNEVIAKVNQYNPDLIILDVMMPEMDGFEVCHNLRMTSDVPIVFLTAKDDTGNKIRGLASGSDDYLTKPFDSAELLLRIKAILRRSGETSNRNEHEAITLSGLVINKSTRQVEVNNQEVNLTTKEFDFLWLLASHPNQVFTREQLIYQVWDSEYAEDTGIVTTLVKRLREKVEVDPANPVFIKTIRGVGYKLGLEF